MILLNTNHATLASVTKLLEEAAAVLARVREKHPIECYELFGQRDFLVDELEGSALMLNQSVK